MGIYWGSGGYIPIEIPVYRPIEKRYIYNGALGQGYSNYNILQYGNIAIEYRTGYIEYLNNYMRLYTNDNLPASGYPLSYKFSAGFPGDAEILTIKRASIEIQPDLSKYVKCNVQIGTQNYPVDFTNETVEISVKDVPANTIFRLTFISETGNSRPLDCYISEMYLS